MYKQSPKSNVEPRFVLSIKPKAKYYTFHNRSKMKLRKFAPILFFLLLLISCKNTNYLSKTYGEIHPNDIIRIEYYQRNNYPDLNRKPDSTITDKQKILQIVTEINHSNNPKPWKGALWDKVILIKKDTILTYHTHRKVIGIHQASGTFYKLNNAQFIHRYFKD